MLLILAGISLSGLIGGKGLFKRTEDASSKYNEAKARETLETVLLTDGQFEKNTNPKYNQEDFLDELIKKEIPGSNVKGDVAIIGDYAYELDRSVPKIGRTLGKADKLVFPKVEITSGPTLAENGRKATFTAKATETTKGIKRIELWLDGKRIEKETKTYDTPQEEIILDFEVNKNGKYTVKAYADLMAKETTTVEGIAPSVNFSPNGSIEWKKQHTTKVTVEETAETITEMKYLWVKDDNVNEPVTSAFTIDCPSDGVITSEDDTMTGTYYLWVLLTTNTGKTNICVSQSFKFDNEAPAVTLESTPASETSFTLTATASDSHSGVAKYEFYINGEKREPDTVTEEEATYTWNENRMTKEKKCYVIVTDEVGNSSNADVISRTKLYAWEKWSNKIEFVFGLGTPTRKNITVYVDEGDYATGYTEIGVSNVPKDKIYIEGSPRDVNLYRRPSDGVGRYYYGEYPLTKFNDASLWGLTVASKLVSYEILSTDSSAGRKRIKWTCDVYTGAYKNEDRIDKFLDEIVYSENPNAYKEGSKNSDGFWYKKLENQ